MSETEKLLTDIREFCRATGMAPTTLGRKAANAGHLVARLENGRPITTTTMERVRAYMAAERARVGGAAA